MILCFKFKNKKLNDDEAAVNQCHVTLFHQISAF